MNSKFLLRAAAVAMMSLVPVTAFSADITIDDPYARTSRPGAPTGAAFMAISNTGSEADRLISVRSDAAKRVELHTHVENADGVMQMIELKEGIPLEPGATHMLARGGDHVMLMGLVDPMEQGEAITVTLVFENAGDVIVNIPVDNERKPDHGAAGAQHKH